MDPLLGLRVQDGVSHHSERGVRPTAGVRGEGARCVNSQQNEPDLKMFNLISPQRPSGIRDELMEKHIAQTMR